MKIYQVVLLIYGVAVFMVSILSGDIGDEPVGFVIAVIAGVMTLTASVFFIIGLFERKLFEKY